MRSKLCCKIVIMDIERPKSKQPIPDHAEKVFSGVMFDVYQWEQELFDGTTTTFEKLKRPDTVIVFPVLPNGHILLTEQEQPGKEPFIGAAGGRVDPGEDVLSAAKRELLEESGYEAERFFLWDARHPASKIEWVVYTFIAKGLTKVADLELDAGERIKLKEVEFEDFVEIATTREFSEKEILSKLFQARLFPEEKKKLKTLFDPTT
ncbi:MAG: NUDIX hydrolase [Candidatus Paceibacterota bacterium]